VKLLDCLVLNFSLFLFALGPVLDEVSIANRDIPALSVVKSRRIRVFCRVRGSSIRVRLFLRVFAVGKPGFDVDFERTG